MLRQLSFKLTLFIFICDVFLTLVALHLAKWLRLSLPYGIELTPSFLNFPWTVYLFVTIIWGTVFLVLPVYDARKTYRAVDQAQVTIIAIGFATLIFAGVAYFFFRELSRFLFFYFFLLDLTFLIGMRIILRVIMRWRRGGWTGKRIRLLILGAGRVGRKLAALLEDYSHYGVEIVGFLDDDAEKANQLDPEIPYLGSLDLTTYVIQNYQVDEVILALPLYAHERLVDIVHKLQDQAINVRVVPDLFELSFVKTTVEDFEGIPLISLRDPVMDPFQRFVKRAFDLIVGTASIVIALPFMVLITILIRLDSPGPIFYMPERVGESGRLFRMFKFRTMVHDAESRRDEVLTYTEDGQPLFKRPDDPRITPIGRILRRTSLDELPQLVNVVKGDMSLVGPRPEMPWLVALYEPWQRKRFAVPQGMTGWWQINGRSDKPMHLHVEEDMYYIQNYSLLLDVIILWKTLATVVKRSGAY